jgi:hypothetical protein
MRFEQIVFPLIRQVVKRPRLTRAIFRLLKTDNTFAADSSTLLAIVRTGQEQSSHLGAAQ